MTKSASHAVNRSNGPPYAQSVISIDSDDGISYEGCLFFIYLIKYTSPWAIGDEAMCILVQMNINMYPCM